MKATASGSDAPWIVGPWQDFLLFFGTPLFILPLASLSSDRTTSRDIALYVAAFGALGHHFPGMLRAYGDRALFERFRTRFFVAPILLLLVALFFSLSDMKGLSVVVLLWGIWHGALQVYGFLRIYDAKVKSFAPLTVNLDWLTCLAWFGAGTLFSPGRMKDILEAFYGAGGPLLHVGAFHAFRDLWVLATAVLTVLFLSNFLRERRRGDRVSFVKLVAMATSCGFWWYTSVVIPEIILGVALFEIFHDVQYLAIVWLFNRNRAERDRAAGGFTRLLFRPSGGLIGVYLGLCFAYGGIRLVPEIFAGETLRRVVLGVVAASTLLHFYYDGFIWKVRERMTREGLGLEGDGAAVSDTPSQAPWLAHSLEWVPFVVPLALFAGSEWTRAEAPPHYYENLRALLPESAYAHNNYGVELRAKGNATEAIAQYEEALAIDPDYARAHSNLGVALLDIGRLEDAEKHLSRALELDPEYAEAHTNLASVLARKNRLDEAERHYRRALSLAPDLLEAHNGLGQCLVSLGKPGDAVPHFERAVRLGPRFPDLRTNLGVALTMSGRKREALAAFDRALDLDPDSLVAMETSSWILATDPDATPSEAERAVSLGERAAEKTNYLDASILDSLGAAYAQSGQFEKAIVAARTASAIAFEEGRADLVRDIEARVALYQLEKPFREKHR